MLDQGKNVHIVDLYVCPTWLPPVSMNPMASIPVSMGLICWIYDTTLELSIDINIVIVNFFHHYHKCNCLPRKFPGILLKTFLQVLGRK